MIRRFQRNITKYRVKERGEVGEGYVSTVIRAHASPNSLADHRAIGPSWSHRVVIHDMPTERHHRVALTACPDVFCAYVC